MLMYAYTYVCLQLIVADIEVVCIWKKKEREGVYIYVPTAHCSLNRGYMYLKTE